MRNSGIVWNEKNANLRCKQESSESNVTEDMSPCYWKNAEYLSIAASIHKTAFSHSFGEQMTTISTNNVRESHVQCFKVQWMAISTWFIDILPDKMVLPDNYLAQCRNKNCNLSIYHGRIAIKFYSNYFTRRKQISNYLISWSAKIICQRRNKSR